EDGRVNIARASGLGDFPARFQLVAAANPCRRGCPSLDRCLCTPAERGRYLGRLSRPLLDRIDLHVELPALAHGDLAGDAVPEPSSAVRARVIAAREPQRARARGTRARVNAALSPTLPRSFCPSPREAVMLRGDLIAEYVVRENVPYVFGLCGHGIVGLMDALGQRADRIKMIGVHHEQVAGYMADAYYRVAPRPAATFTSCGPGS